MNGKTHAIVGANAVWVLPLVATVDWQAIPLVAIGAVAGLLPDIDAREAEIHDETFNVTKLFFINKFFGHRRFFHSFLAAGLVYLAVDRFVPPVLPALPEVVLAGYLSHELIDGFNTKGVCYFYPSNWCIEFLPEFLQSPCGGWADHLFFFLGAMGLGAFCAQYGWQVWESALRLFGIG